MEGIDEPGLSDARLAGDDHPLALPVAGPGPAVVQESELELAAHQRCLRAAPDTEARSDPADPHGAGEPERIGDTLELSRTEVLGDEDPRNEASGRGGHDNGVRRGAPSTRDAMSAV